MESIVLTVILIAVIAGAATYIYRAKKRGQTCIGCPHAKECAAKSCGEK